MYEVLYNNRPALFDGMEKKESLFSDFVEAKAYALYWLGDYEMIIPENWDGSPVDYSGCGDIISIRKVEQTAAPEWFQTLPTKPGYYWLYNDDGNYCLVAEVSFHESGNFVWFCGTSKLAPQNQTKFPRQLLVGPH